MMVNYESSHWHCFSPVWQCPGIDNTVRVKIHNVREDSRAFPSEI
jgi:hypothetical protein